MRLKALALSCVLSSFVFSLPLALQKEERLILVPNRVTGMMHPRARPPLNTCSPARLLTQNPSHRLTLLPPLSSASSGPFGEFLHPSEATRRRSSHRSYGAPPVAPLANHPCCALVFQSLPIWRDSSLPRFLRNACCCIVLRQLRHILIWNPFGDDFHPPVGLPGPTAVPHRSSLSSV